MILQVVIYFIENVFGSQIFPCFHFWLVVFSQHEIILWPFFRMTALARTHQGFFDESFWGGTCERGQKVGDIFFVGCYFCLGRLIIIWVFPKIMVPPNHQF